MPNFRQYVLRLNSYFVVCSLIFLRFLVGSFSVVTEELNVTDVVPHRLGRGHYGLCTYMVDPITNGHRTL